MNFVLDASALIAFLRDEPGAGAVARVLSEDESRCYAHALNLCEVYYDFRRAAGQKEALRALADLERLGVVEDAALTPMVWQAAGAIKADLRRISLADCFAVELTRRRNGTLLTADHHEFDRVVDRGVCEIKFIR